MVFTLKQLNLVLRYLMISSPAFLCYYVLSNDGSRNCLICHVRPKKTKQDHNEPYRTMTDHTGPYGTIQDHTGPCETILDNTRPYRTVPYSTVPTGPYGTLEYQWDHTRP